MRGWVSGSIGRGKHARWGARTPAAIARVYGCCNWTRTLDLKGEVAG